MNTVMVCSNQRAGFAQYNLYVMEVDQGNRNCYNCEEFRYLARNCRSRGTENRIGKESRLEYRQRRMIKRRNEDNTNLNGD